MVLASDLRGSGGRMLLPAQVILQETHLKTLRAWGVTEADILDPSQDQPGDSGPIEVSPELLEQSREYLRPFFVLANLDHVAMNELFRLASARLAGQLTRGREIPEPPWSEQAVKGAEPLSEEAWKKVPKTPEALFRGKVELVSLPAVYSQIVEVLNSPRSSAADLAAMVSKDTSLASRLLKLVNSVFYGFPARIDSISRAITLIGTNELTTMALGISVVRAFKDIPAGLMSMEGFWRHSIACGIFARLLAAQKVGTSEEQLFVGGLLHDIGRMIMLKQIPVPYSAIISEARQQQLALYTMEKRRLTFDHMDVGLLLCQQWNFSKALEEMIGCHHYPGRGRYALGCSIIHVADLMAKVYCIGQGECGCIMISPLQERVWDSLGLAAGGMAPIFSQAERQINEVIRLFLGEDDPDG
jgi:putative nucleotidyltransferase with HDIG domain